MLRSHLCNDLETVSASKHPDILKAKEALLKYGAIGALMSGSGPAVFGLFASSATARKAKQALSRDNDWQLYLADMITQDTGYSIEQIHGMPAINTWIRDRVSWIKDLAYFSYGASSSGKTQDFGSCIRRFESSRPSQISFAATLIELTLH